jgi:hypothetical protein
MKRRIVLFFILLAVPALLFANYEANIAAGLAAYKQNKLIEAYKFYYAAYKEKPSPKLQQIMQFIKNKYKTSAASAVKPAAKQNTPWKWVLLGVDAAALGFTFYAGSEYFKQADVYDGLYKLIDNTTPANYEILKTQDKIFHEKEGMYAAGIVITSLAVGYTLADLLFIHAAFPITTAAGYDPRKGEVKLAFNYKY